MLKNYVRVRGYILDISMNMFCMATGLFYNRLWVFFVFFVLFDRVLFFQVTCSRSIGECAVCLHKNKKHVVLKVDMFGARYFVPFL